MNPSDLPDLRCAQEISLLADAAFHNKGGEWTLAARSTEVGSPYEAAGRTERASRELEIHYHAPLFGRDAVRVSRVEKSLDIYPKSERDDDRQLMTEAVRRHFLPDDYCWQEQDRWPRSTYWDGRHPKWPINKPTPRPRHKAKHRISRKVSAEHLRDLSVQSYRQPPVDATFYTGREEGELLVRPAVARPPTS